MSIPLCDNCGISPASVFITKVINQDSSSFSYCEDCAREKALGEGWLAHLTEQLGEDSLMLEEHLKEALKDFPGQEVMARLFEGVNLNFEKDFLPEEDSLESESLDRKESEDDQDIIPLQSSQELPARCNSCGTTWDKLKGDGRAGCSSCYLAFKDQLEEVMARLQRGPHHVGKIPRAAAKRKKRLEQLRQRRDNQLSLLQGRLKDAVQAEQYEEAAKLRDKIKIVSSTIVSPQ